MSDLRLTAAERPTSGPTGHAETRTRWTIVALAVGAGVIAGLQVGKVPPAIPEMRTELGLSLVTAGWMASLFNAVGAALGIAAGLFADRIGARRSIGLGVLLLALGSAGGSLSTDAWHILLARTVEGIGFVAVVVAGPRIIVAAARPQDHGLTLGIWGTYMPAGMAVAMLAAPLILPAFGWRGLWLVNVGVMLAFALIFVLATAPRRWPAAPTAGGRLGAADLRATVLRPGPWLLGGCFACYSIQFFAVMSWLPTFLIETQGRSLAAASLFGAITVAANVIGNVASAWAMHAGVGRRHLMATAYLVMAGCAVGIFADVVDPVWKLPLALAFSAFGGLLPAATLAGAAAHAPTAAQVSTTNGFVVQGANTGSLLGPPVMALLVAVGGGWQQTWGLMVACGALGLILLAGLARVERQLR